MRALTSLFLLVVLLLVGSTSQLQAQTGFQLPFFPEVGTSVFVRPSQMPSNKYFFSLPFLPVTDTRFVNSGLDYYGAHMITDQGTYINLDQLLSKLKRRNSLAFNQQTDLLDFGFRAGRSYFSVNVSHKVDFNFLYTDEFMQLLLLGNGPFIGKTIDLSTCGFDASHYWDIGFGYTAQINDQFSAGVRVKRLIGLDNISSSIQSLTATTRANDYALQLSSNAVVNTCSPLLDSEASDSIFSGSDRVIDYLMGNGNGGWGASFGLGYKPSERLTVSFDALDIGKIKWVTRPVNYRLDKGNYSFSGVSLNQLINQSADSVDYLDSLGNAFPTTETRQSYSTSLTSTVMLSAQYLLTASTTGILAVRGTMFQQQVLPSFQLMLRQRIGNFFAVSAKDGLRYDYVSSFGMGAYLRLGSVNLFVISDDVFGTLYPLRGKCAQANFGVLFGAPVRARKKPYAIPSKSQNSEAPERY